MIETTHSHPTEAAHDRSAVGRLIMLVDVADGTEKVTYERRLPDASTARHWCEEKVRSAGQASAILEIQVTEEVWGHRHAWEATPGRHIPETLQIGLRTDDGAIAWGAPHALGQDRRTRL